MQENEFEKQVKSRMDELGFTPSAPVWEAIKKQIEKKKRRALPFIFLLAAVVTAGSYFIYIDVNKHIKKSDDNISFNTQKKNKLSSQNNTIKEKQAALPDLGKSHSMYANIKKVKHHYNSENAAALSMKDNSHLHHYKFIIAQNESKKHSQTNENIILLQQPAEKNYSSTTDSIVNSKTITTADASSHINDSIEKDHVVQNSDSNLTAVKINQTQKDKNKIADTLSSALKKSRQLNKPNAAKWNWGITAMVGRSNIVNNFRFNNFQSAKANNLDALPGDTAAVAAYKSKPYWPTKAYDFGIVVQRKILKNSYINFGLQYLHLSTKSYTAISLNNSLIQVAPYTYNLTTPGNYFISGTTKTYTNKYNFIELPLSFQSSLLRKKQFGILYDAGASVMQLIKKNSLLYNSNDKIYFNDSSNLMRHTQFQLSAGLDFQLQTRHIGSFVIGPGVKYSFTRIS